MIKCLNEQIAVLEERLKRAKEILALCADDSTQTTSELSAVLGQTQLRLTKLFAKHGWPWKRNYE
jgi:hypothetical protein